MRAELVGSVSPGDVAGGCKLLRNRYESRDREWATYTCVLGFHVYGEQGRRVVEPCRRDGGAGGACPGLGMLGVCGGVGIMILADPVQEAPRALPREGLPGTRPVGGRCCRSARNGTALGCGWRRGGGRAEASHCARRVAGRLGWHRHQLPVPLPQRARGGCGRRLLQSASLPVPVRARQGEASRSLRGWTGEQGPGPRSSRNSTFPPTQAPSLVYGGHGSHVTSVRFTHDDSHLISLGGKDASIFQWRVLGAGGAGPALVTPSRTPSLSPASSLDV